MSDLFDLNELPSVDLLEKDRLPATAGIYFAVDCHNRLLYVGKAQNLNNRWANHHRYHQLEQLNKKNSIKLKWYGCKNDEETLTKLEKYFIDTYYPELNQTKVEIKKVTPAEISLRKTLAKISKYVIVYGYEENSQVFGLPTVLLKYDWLNHSPARILRQIFDADNKKGSLRWSYYSRRQTTPIWYTKCNGVCIVVGCDININYCMQKGEHTILAGISLLNISAENFNRFVSQTDISQSYYPNLQRYIRDPIPLLWSKELSFSQPDIEEIKEINRKRTESKIGQSRSRGRQVEVYCEAIGKGKCVIKAYKEAIEWFGGYELLGLKKADYLAWRQDANRKWIEPHKVTVRIPEGDSYRSLSAPISLSSHTEIEQRIERIRQLSPLHSKVKFKI